MGISVTRRKSSDDWIVYILRCADASLYTGITNDLGARLQKHEEGKGAKYTRGRGPLQLVFQETCSSKGAALKRERAIKALSRAQKLELLAQALDSGAAIACGSI